MGRKKLRIFKSVKRKLRARTLGRLKRTILAQQTAFLEALGETGSIQSACALSKVPRTNAYQWRRENAGKNKFAEAWDKALEESADTLEDEAVRRGHKGVKQPVYQQGELVGYKQEYSDNLLMFMLKGRRPKRFMERHAITDADGKTLPPPAMHVHFVGKRREA
jgi:hypothetical protein